MLQIIGLGIVSYLVGSLPVGLLVGKWRGVNLRQVGSGNVGATNVYRALGLGLAILVFILDVGKGLVATRAIPLLWAAAMSPANLRLVCGMAAILGSVASLFMRFRGGKGVATAVGVFLGLQPLATAICVGIWAGLFVRFRYVSLGSMAGALALPVLVAAFNRGSFLRDPVFMLAAVVALLVIIRHRANIQRLLKGTENRMGRVQGKR